MHQHSDVIIKKFLHLQYLFDKYDMTSGLSDKCKKGQDVGFIIRNLQKCEISEWFLF